MEKNTLLPVVVPLIVVMVLKMSDISRSIDLQEIDRSSWSPIVIPINSVESYGLGRFPILHGLNALVLWGLYYYSLFSGLNGVIVSSELNVGIAAFVGLFLLLLPVFEIHKYDKYKLDESWNVPKSMKSWTKNITASLALMTLHVITYGIASSSSSFSYSLTFSLISIISIILSAGFWGGANRAFFRNLNNEIDKSF